MSENDLTRPNTPTGRESFKRGMLFSLGFSIPFILLFWAGFGLLAWVIRDGEEPQTKQSQPATFGPNSGLKVIKHRAVTGSASLYVVGVVANTGKDSWDTVTIVVRLFDADGQVVGLCKEGLWAKVRPGTQIDFQVDCDDWYKDAFPRYQRYSVEVGDARPEIRFGA